MRRLLLLAAVLLGLSASPAYAYPGVLDEFLETEHFFATSLLAGQTPSIDASGQTGRDSGSMSTRRVVVNRLASRFVSIAPPAADETPCYAATLSLTVTLPAGVTTRPHVYTTGTRVLTPLSVSGSTASASIP